MALAVSVAAKRQVLSAAKPRGAAADQDEAQPLGSAPLSRPRVRLRRVPWLIPGWAQAQAWPRLILIRRGVLLTEALLAHELAHVDQWRRLGTLAFVWRYCRDFWRYGYAAHPLEAEARAAAADPHYLGWARLLLQGQGNDQAPPAASPSEST